MLMLDRGWIGGVAVAAALMLAPAGAPAFDDSKYPDLKGQWIRVGIPNWTPAGAAPLTPEYRAVYDANRADMAKGGPGDLPPWYCLPQGMPMVMTLYDPIAIAIPTELAD